MMVTIATIVHDVLDERKLTLPQRRKISVLLNTSNCTDEDMSAMLVLVDALRLVSRRFRHLDRGYPVS